MIEAIVQILDEILRLRRRELLFNDVAATHQLLLQSVQRSDRAVGAGVDARIVAAGAVGVVQAFAVDIDPGNAA